MPSHAPEKAAHASEDGEAVLQPGIPSNAPAKPLGRISATSRACGSCSLCCKLFAVAELIKPRDTWCRHVVLGKGCGLHPNWPKICNDFLCLWRDERLAPMLPEKAKPDRCGVVLTAAGGGKAVVAVCQPDKPMAWRDSPEIHMFLTIMARTGASVSVRAGNVYFIVGSRGFMEVPHEWAVGDAGPNQEFTVSVPDAIRMKLGIGPDMQPRSARMDTAMGRLV